MRLILCWLAWFKTAGPSKSIPKTLLPWNGCVNSRFRNSSIERERFIGEGAELVTLRFSLVLKMQQEVHCKNGPLPTTSSDLSRPGTKAVTKCELGQVSPGAEEVQGMPSEEWGAPGAPGTAKRPALRSQGGGRHVEAPGSSVRARRARPGVGRRGPASGGRRLRARVLLTVRVSLGVETLATAAVVTQKRHSVS